MTRCAITGGCPSDYVAVSISALCVFLLLARSAIPFLYYKLSIPKGSAFWVPAIQILASLDLMVAIVMSVNLIKIEKRHWWWNSCYIWAVWLEGPFGFGLLLSCRIVQVFHLYFIFVKKHLPPLRSHIFLLLVLLPWVAAAAFIQLKKPLNHRCQMSAQWVAPLMVLHSIYVVIFVGLTRSIQHVNFRFDELTDLWRGVLVSTLSVVLWVVAYILNEIHDDVDWLRIASRFLLALMTSVFILAFFSYSSSQPLLSQVSLSKRECPAYESMSQALGIPNNGIQPQRRQSMAVDCNEPLDKLLLDRRFRRSFMAFADSCLAGESVHFYEEVLELGELPADDSVSRIYMARHIIQKYIVSGAPMEVNISHRTRQQILNSVDLGHPDLFKTALIELLQLMKTNLARDYWSSVYYMKFKEADAKMSAHELEMVTNWNITPRLSCVHAPDDPFHQENLFKSSDVMPSQ
ncbi:Regulator of G-protein signaling 1 [Bienertia sinuspersici]